jgi:ribosomal protein L37AE/L43A
MPHLTIIVSFPQQFTGPYCAVIGLLYLLDFLHSQTRNSEKHATEFNMATNASTARSVYGMTCDQCGNGLIAPELSECVSERHVRHLWRCTNCNAQFEMSAYFRTDTDPKISDDDMRKVFLSRLTA